MSIFKHLEDRSIAHITRFNSLPQHFHENVADHSFFVAYTVSILCLVLDKNNIKVNRERAVTMALVHDMEEIFSGDILSRFKHHSKEVSSAISKVNKALIGKIFEDLPDDIANHYSDLWKEEGAQESIEAQVVKVSDKISLLTKCKEEMKAGNEFFSKIYDYEIKKLDVYDKSWWQTIKKDVLE